MVFILLLGTQEAFGLASSPTVSITYPQEGNTVSGAVTVRSTATDDAKVSTTKFFVDDVAKGSDHLLPYEYYWNTTWEVNGEHIIKVIAIDGAGSEAEDSIKVIVQNEAPKVAARLVRASGTTAVYAEITADQWVWIPDPNVFETLFGQDAWSAIETISYEDWLGLSKVILLRERETQRIFLLTSSGEGAMKHELRTEEVLVSYGYSSADAAEAPSALIDGYETVNLMKTSDRPEVYAADEGHRVWWIPDETTFAELGFSWDRVVTVTRQELDTYEFLVTDAQKEIVGAVYGAMSKPLPSGTYYATAYETSGPFANSFHVMISAPDYELYKTAVRESFDDFRNLSYEPCVPPLAGLVGVSSTVIFSAPAPQSSELWTPCQ